MSAFLLTACGDDESSGFTTRHDKDSSSSVCEDCDDSSSSSAESLSSDASSISFFEDGVTGTMTDGRDGQTYKIVKIGRQIWMAENLNYAYTDVPYSYDGSTSDSTSWCYNDSAEYCAKYGRLYTWAAAMDSVGTWSTNGKGCGAGTTCSPTYPVRGICPEGWHLPDTVETDMLLFTEVGGYSIAGKMLKSTSGWDENGNGTDAYSFAMLPAGYKTVRGYYGMGGSADFWVSSGYWGFNDMLAISLNSYEEDASVVGTSKYYGFPVRCVKDGD